jgi:hypothetical protein
MVTGVAKLIELAPRPATIDRADSTCDSFIKVLSFAVLPRLGSGLYDGVASI